MAAPRTVDRIVALIRDTSSSLPDDAERGLRAALRREEKGSGAVTVLSTILKNVKLARKDGTPLCQDTGTVFNEYGVDFFHAAPPLLYPVLRIDADLQDPRAVRYGWADFKPGNIHGVEGLPLVPFYLTLE